MSFQLTQIKGVFALIQVMLRLIKISVITLRFYLLESLWCHKLKGCISSGLTWLSGMRWRAAMLASSELSICWFVSTKQFQPPDSNNSLSSCKSLTTNIYLTISLLLIMIWCLSSISTTSIKHQHQPTSWAADQNACLNAFKICIVAIFSSGITQKRSCKSD